MYLCPLISEGKSSQRRCWLLKIWEVWRTTQQLFVEASFLSLPPCSCCLCAEIAKMVLNFGTQKEYRGGGGDHKMVKRVEKFQDNKNHALPKSRSEIKPVFLSAHTSSLIFIWNYKNRSLWVHIHNLDHLFDTYKICFYMKMKVIVHSSQCAVVIMSKFYFKCILHV